MARKSKKIVFVRTPRTAREIAARKAKPSTIARLAKRAAARKALLDFLPGAQAEFDKVNAAIDEVKARKKALERESAPDADKLVKEEALLDAYKSDLKNLKAKLKEAVALESRLAAYAAARG